MRTAIWFIAAVCAYFISGINLSIILSKLIYHEDIREKGSKNPGFTNFKRVYGNKYAWFIFAYDLIKGAALAALFGYAFMRLGYSFQLGAAYTGVFSTLGTSYPALYRFKGGKGFLVILSTLFVIDWRCGLFALLLMMALVLTVKYMSLATMTALVLGAAGLFILKADITAAVIFSITVVFMIWRHRENIKRLIKGTETKFSLKGKGRSEGKDG